MFEVSLFRMFEKVILLTDYTGIIIPPPTIIIDDSNRHLVIDWSSLGLGLKPEYEIIQSYDYDQIKATIGDHIREPLVKAIYCPERVSRMIAMYYDDDIELFFNTL